VVVTRKARKRPKAHAAKVAAAARKKVKTTKKVKVAAVKVLAAAKKKVKVPAAKRKMLKAPVVKVLVAVLYKNHVTGSSHEKARASRGLFFAKLAE
jgi:hypothetical protein